MKLSKMLREFSARSFFEISEAESQTKAELSEKNIPVRKHLMKLSKMQREFSARSFFEIDKAESQTKAELGEKDLEENNHLQ